MSSFSEMHEHVIDGQLARVAELTQVLLDAGESPEDILYKGLLPGMAEVGERFERGEYFIPEMLLAARALTAGLDILRPHLSETAMSPTGKVVIGTVEGDIHDIGKNLVGVMLQGAGFTVIDAGVDVSPATFVELIREHSPDIIGLSALLTTTMPMMEDTIEAIKASGLRDRVKVFIGGAPITQDYANRIGADGYGRNASVAAKVAEALMEAA